MFATISIFRVNVSDVTDAPFSSDGSAQPWMACITSKIRLLSLSREDAISGRFN